MCPLPFHCMTVLRCLPFPFHFCFLTVFSCPMITRWKHVWKMANSIPIFLSCRCDSSATRHVNNWPKDPRHREPQRHFPSLPSQTSRATGTHSLPAPQTSMITRWKRVWGAGRDRSSGSQCNHCCRTVFAPFLTYCSMVVQLHSNGNFIFNPTVYRYVTGTAKTDHLVKYVH